MADIIAWMQQTFEWSKHMDGDTEFWVARELMPLLGYDKRERFLDTIIRAQQSCEASGKSIPDHFFPAPGKTSLKGGRPKEDFFLTRYACYLIAQNGDSRKPEIAHAQDYFALQTRTQELYQQRVQEDKRLAARAKLKETESKIEDTVYDRWITHPAQFATFKNSKIQALYQTTIRDLKEKRGIPSHRALADFDSEVELKAKDFVYAMTDHNIKTKNVRWQDSLTEELTSNAKATRKTLLERNIVPENLPPSEDLQKIEKRRKREQKLPDKKDFLPSWE